MKSEIEGSEPLSDYARAYLNERVRNSFYDYVLRKFHEAADKENLSKAQLARRLNLGPDRISKILGAPGNWTLDTISELLVGICREELVPNSASYLDRAPRNYRADTFFSSLPSMGSQQTAETFSAKSAASQVYENIGQSKRTKSAAEMRELQ